MVDKGKLIGSVSGALSAGVPFAMDPGYSSKVKALLVAGGVGQAYPMLKDLVTTDSTTDPVVPEDGALNLDVIISTSGIIATGMGVMMHYKETGKWDEATIAIAVGAAANAAMMLYDALQTDDGDSTAVAV